MNQTPANVEAEWAGLPDPERAGAWARRAAGILNGVTDVGMRLVLREAFEERSAICEFDGGLSRDQAEQVAYDELVLSLRKRPDLIPPTHRSAAGQGGYYCADGVPIPRGRTTAEWAAELRRMAAQPPYVGTRQARVYVEWAIKLESAQGG